MEEAGFWRLSDSKIQKTLWEPTKIQAYSGVTQAHWELTNYYDVRFWIPGKTYE
jgi:hypothetical protein